MENKQLLWALLGIVIVIIVAAAAFMASRGAVPPQSGEQAVLTTTVTEADWQLGATDAKWTLVEYSDFECPACAAYHPVLKQLLADYPNELKLVYRHFPLPQHAAGKLATLYAEAAGRQGKFWEMSDLLFGNQQSWAGKKNNDTVFLGYASRLGLDLEKFKADLKDPALAAKVAADTKSGSEAEVNSTPSFFLNGLRISNPRGYEDFKTVLENNELSIKR